MRVGLHESGGLIVDDAEIGPGVQVKGIIAGEADFDKALATPHGVNAGTNEIAVIKNVAGGGHQVHVGERWLKNLGAAAGGRDIELAGAQRGDERAAGRLDDDVARNFLQVNVARDAFQLHIAGDLFNINQPGLSFELEFGLFGHGKLKIGFDFVGQRRRTERRGADVTAIADLLDVNFNFVGDGCTVDADLWVFASLDLDASVVE